MLVKQVKVLVIWNEFTEGLKFVVLLNPSPEELMLLIKVHMHYINAVSTKISIQKEIDKVYAAAFDSSTADIEARLKPWFGRWRNNVYTEKTISGVSDISQVFITGIFP